MVKLYKNKYLRKYREDFMLHLWSKKEPLDNLGRNILQKYKSKIIWRSVKKKRTKLNIKSQNLREFKYLAVRSLKRSAYFWIHLRVFDSEYCKDKREKKIQIKQLQFSKFDTLFRKALVNNRHKFFYCNLDSFFHNVYWFVWGKYTNFVYVKYLYIAYLLNWNYAVDFKSFELLKQNSKSNFSFLHLKDINLNSYIYDSFVGSSDKGMYSKPAGSSATLVFKPFDQVIKEAF